MLSIFSHISHLFIHQYAHIRTVHVRTLHTPTPVHTYTPTHPHTCTHLHTYTHPHLYTPTHHPCVYTLPLQQHAGANVLKNIPETALKLTANDMVKRLVAQDGAQPLSPVHRVVIGGLAGAAAQGVVGCSVCRGGVFRCV